MVARNLEKQAYKATTTEVHNLLNRIVATLFLQRSGTVAQNVQTINIIFNI